MIDGSRETLEFMMTSLGLPLGPVTLRPLSSNVAQTRGDVSRLSALRGFKLRGEDADSALYAYVDEGLGFTQSSICATKPFFVHRVLPVLEELVAVGFR